MYGDWRDGIVKPQNDYCGITAWHNEGITGKGVAVWCMEGDTAHGKKTAQRVLDAAPDCTLFTGSCGAAEKNGKITECYRVDPATCEKTEIEIFIRENSIKVLTVSLDEFLDSSNAKREYFKRLQDKYNLILINSGGNDGNIAEDYTRNNAWMIGAVNLTKGGAVKRAPYSTTAQGLDFATFAGWTNGTSFAAPYLAGQAALIIQKFGELPHKRIYEILKSACIDLQEKGEDVFTGWGIPVLTNIWNPNYTEESMKKTEFIDVKEGAWYEEAVAFCVEKGYMKGISDIEFAPNEPLTRAQAAQIIFNILGE